MIRRFCILVLCLSTTAGCQTVKLVYGADNKPYKVPTPRSGETHTVHTAGRAITYRVPSHSRITYSAFPDDRIHSHGSIINFQPRRDPAARQKDIYVGVFTIERDAKSRRPWRLERRQLELANGTWTEQNVYNPETNLLVAINYIRSLSPDSEIRIVASLGPHSLKRAPSAEIVAQMRDLCREFAANLVFGD